MSSPYHFNQTRFVLLVDAVHDLIEQHLQDDIDTEILRKKIACFGIDRLQALFLVLGIHMTLNRRTIALNITSLDGYDWITKAKVAILRKALMD